MGLGRATAIVARYGSQQVAQFSLAPLVVHLIADAAANTGLLMDLGGELRAVLQPLQAAFADKA